MWPCGIGDFFAEDDVSKATQTVACINSECFFKLLNSILLSGSASLLIVTHWKTNDLCPGFFVLFCFALFCYFEWKCCRHSCTDFCINMIFHFSQINVQGCIAGPYGNYMFSFVKTAKLFQSGCTIFRFPPVMYESSTFSTFHQQHLVLLLFLILAILIKKKAEHWRINSSELWCWRRFLRVPWTARRSKQSMLKEISTDYSAWKSDAEAETPIL